jgi:hypothetical protein
LKEIPFASLTNAIDMKIESSNRLFDWLNMGESVHRWEVVNPAFVKNGSK